MRVPSNLSVSLTGSRVRILKSKDESLENLTGKIIKETRNTFKVKKSSGSMVSVLKRICDFLIEVNNQKWLVKGKALENRFD